MGKDFDAGEGMLSASERKEVLEYENMLAEQRDVKAREFQLDSERQRKAMEEQVRQQEERAEAARRKELETQEREAADFAPDARDAMLRDRDLKKTTMWQNLAGGITKDKPGTNAKYPD
tara:strand:+ start:8913 stop:9269 length:357 start_codon:yes stop_codon:yes gene_type:complete